ncbi:uncharacterized protein LOC143776384 [Ranitomeya variabilis]|uniref:uncharacterized protein LOC143776384 n=1 Tax=Ranitomeya variabilis TaxID=490064 RepID=UPI004055E408
MDLRPTQSNHTGRETGSDSESIIDQVGEGEEVAGPSSQPSSCITQAPPAPAPVAATGLGPAAAPAPCNLDEPGYSSSPTVPLEASPQPAVISRRRRRRRDIPASDTRRHVDTGVLNYLSRAARDEDAYSRSLARYLRALPREVRLRVRGSLQILIDSCTPPNTSYELLEFLEGWHRSPHNLLRVNPNPDVNGQYGSDAPPPLVPTPQPIPPQNQP